MQQGAPKQMYLYYAIIIVGDAMSDHQSDAGDSACLCLYLSRFVVDASAFDARDLRL